jgi:hypothetical protein
MKTPALSTELDEGGARADDGFWIVVSKGGDGTVVRGDLAQEPERFEIPNASSLQVP